MNINTSYSRANVGGDFASHNLVYTDNSKKYYYNIGGSRKCRLAAWLYASSVSFKQICNGILDKRTEGTGHWVLQLPEFRTWRDSAVKNLVLTGMPGAGKTMLAAIITDHLRNTAQKTDVVLCAFFRYDAKTSQSISGVLANLLGQLVEQTQSDDDISPMVWKLYSTNSLTIPSIKALSEAFKSQLEACGYQTIYLILDAMDEFSSDDADPHHLIYNLEQLHYIQILTTSRKESDCVGFCVTDKSASFKICAKDNDVLAFVEHQFRLPRSWKITLTSQLRERVRNAIRNNARGMFLVARLQISSLQACRTKFQISNLLDILPEGLDETYKISLMRIKERNDSDYDLFVSAARWLLYAEGAFTAEMMEYAVTARPKLRVHNNVDHGLVRGDSFLDVCAGLVVRDEVSDSFRFVHKSANEFFERFFSGPDLHEPHLHCPAQQELAESCLWFLGSSADSSNPFYQYAALNWGVHANRAKEKFCLSPNAEDTLSHLKNKIASTMANPLPSSSQRILIDIIISHPVRNIMIYFDMSKPLQETIDRTKLLEKDAEGRTPLMIASMFSSYSTVEMLIQELRSAEEEKWDMDTSDQNGRTALSFAAEHSTQEISTLLIKHGADVKSRDRQGYTPLAHLALQAGVNAVLGPRHREITAKEDIFGIIQRDVGVALLKAGAAVDCRDIYGRTPLSYAIERGDAGLGISLFLIGNGADINSAEKTPSTLAKQLATSCFAPGSASSAILRSHIDDLEAYRKERGAKRASPDLFLIGNGADINSAELKTPNTLAKQLATSCFAPGSASSEMLLRHIDDLEAYRRERDAKRIEESVLEAPELRCVALWS